MKNITRLLCLFLFTLFYVQFSYSQTTIYTEDFEGSDLTGYAVGNGDTNTDYGTQVLGGTASDYIKRGLVGSFAFAGALIGFLWYNTFPAQIFMGDTGSMIVGFLLAFFTISFISQSQTNINSEYFKASPALALAMLFFPLMDTFRIFFIRIFVLKKSPFSADKHHIHHRFIQAGFTHVQTTMFIVLINFVHTP